MSNDSELQIIGKYAFCFSSIESITIPRSLVKICEYAFCSCKKLQHIEIPSESQLQTIEKFAFSSSSIKNIVIPSNLIELKEGWCCWTSELTNISVIQDFIR